MNPEVRTSGNEKLGVLLWRQAGGRASLDGDGVREQGESLRVSVSVVWPEG